MDIANVLSYRMGLIPVELRNRVRTTLEKVWRGSSIENIDYESFLAALARDKKNEGKENGFELVSLFA